MAKPIMALGISTIPEGARDLSIRAKIGLVIVASVAFAGITMLIALVGIYKENVEWLSDVDALSSATLEQESVRMSVEAVTLEALGALAFACAWAAAEPHQRASFHSSTRSGQDGRDISR